MASLQLATVVPPKFSLYYSIKGSSYRTAGKRTVEGPNAGCFSSPCPKPLKACLAAAPVSGETEPDIVKKERIPKHVAVITDGNRRWAKNSKLAAGEAHRAGRDNLAALICNSCEIGIDTLSIFSFSKENMTRTKMEVDSSLRSIENYIRSDVKELMTRYNIRISVIGNRSNLPESLQSAISASEEMSRGNKGLHFVMALNYSGRDDVVEAARKIAAKVEEGVLEASEIDESIFEQELMTKTLEFPNPDLLIRTGGEIRISNFLLWQSAYSEFYFSDKLFPDFGRDDLLRAIASYQRRQRRYGKSEELI